jgi:8-hydroxy-5-deazaflavin:NADPH oxidoreductase
MNIAILGGTGKEGAGLGARWAQAGHAIIIGSRDEERARGKAVELRERTGRLTIIGHDNVEAARLGEVIVVALPAAGLAVTLPALRDACRGKVVVSTVVALDFRGPRLFVPPAIGSSAEEVRSLLPDARVVAAFQHIAAHELAELDQSIDCDLLMCGDDAEAKQTVSALGESMGLRVVDAGPLANSGALEGITALLATINRRYKLHNAGFRITGL